MALYKVAEELKLGPGRIPYRTGQEGRPTGITQRFVFAYNTEKRGQCRDGVADTDPTKRTRERASREKGVVTEPTLSAL